MKPRNSTGVREKVASSFREANVSPTPTNSVPLTRGTITWSVIGITAVLEDAEITMSSPLTVDTGTTILTVPTLPTSITSGPMPVVPQDLPVSAGKPTELRPLDTTVMVRISLPHATSPSVTSKAKRSEYNTITNGTLVLKDKSPLTFKVVVT